ncbi:MAG: Hint domain-containing protein [Kiritimatiellaeota bacterium]|nr:Hint domain-containing protein [Kiritimatiellota bacterium]
MRRLLAMMIAAGALAGASQVQARGGGGCLEAGTGILTPAGEVPIEQLQRGDAVVGLRDGRRMLTTVADVFMVQPDEFIELTSGGRTLRLTPEHPVATAEGCFLAAGVINKSTTVQTIGKSEYRNPKTETNQNIKTPNEARGILSDLLPFEFVSRFEIRNSSLSSVRRLAATRPAYNLLVAEGGVFFAHGVLVHNKGCFLPDTDILLADGSRRKLSAVQPGDHVRAFDSANRLVLATVAEIITRDVDEFVELKTALASVRVTPEHPFCVGAGRFKTVAALRSGDEVFLCDGAGLQPQHIISLVRVRAPVRVYNLRTDAPHTFFANAFAVHNKGGGCFPAGTRIATPAGATPIEQLAPGDAVLGVDAAGVGVTANVRRLYRQTDRLLTLHTARGELRTTAEHPLRLFAGGFRSAAAVRLGDELAFFHSGCLGPARVSAKGSAPDLSVVFNLEVDAPHTFIADGFVAHNKGGGGGGHSSSSRGGRRSGGGSGNDNPVPILIFMGLFMVVFFSIARYQKQQKDENLDFVYAPGRVAAKAGQTLKLLEFLARQDEALQPARLEQVARGTFLKLQECWQARAYGPMQPLMMRDLYLNHGQQLASLQRNHEINMIDHLSIARMDLVNVRYTHKPDQREFTALITARAKDYYLDDRTQKFLRGDEAAAEFQEFWTFQRQGDAWLLREIEQSRESDALQQENFVEQFTDTQLRQIYGGTADAAGPAGPWLDQATETKATQIERMLNFLAQTDKLWNRQAMEERSRQVFTAVKLAEESGDAAGVLDGLFPDAAEHLTQQLAAQRQRGLAVEYRNLCVRKVELILVRNFADNTKDEFTARISAHAQQIARRADAAVVTQNEYVAPFVEFWTFGRRDNQWKLKEVLPPAAGEKAVSAENVDEDSSPAQVRWYYTKTRAN